MYTCNYYNYYVTRERTTLDFPFISPKSRDSIRVCYSAGFLICIFYSPNSSP